MFVYEVTLNCLKLNKAVLELQVSPAFVITYFCKIIVISDLTLFSKIEKVIDPLDDL